MLGIGIGVNAVQQGLGPVSVPGSGPEGSTAYVNYKSAPAIFDYGNNTFEDFLYENTDYGTWEGDVVPGTGFVPSAELNNISIGNALTAELLTSGAMTVVANVVLPIDAFIRLEMIDLPDWNQDITCGAAMNGDLTVMQASANSGPGNMFGPQLTGTSGTIRIAMSIDEDGARASLNGSTCATSALGDALIVNHAGFWLVGAIIEDLTFYGGAKTDGELEALSA